MLAQAGGRRLFCWRLDSLVPGWRMANPGTPSWRALPRIVVLLLEAINREGVSLHTLGGEEIQVALTYRPKAHDRASVGNAQFPVVCLS